jgi:hypothetical protein
MKKRGFTHPSAFILPPFAAGSYCEIEVYDLGSDNLRRLWGIDEEPPFSRQPHAKSPPTVEVVAEKRARSRQEDSLLISSRKRNRFVEMPRSDSNRPRLDDLTHRREFNLSRWGVTGRAESDLGSLARAVHPGGLGLGGTRSELLPVPWVGESQRSRELGRPSLREFVRRLEPLPL